MIDIPYSEPALRLRMDRRRNARVPSSLCGELATGNDAYPIETDDLSLAGARLEVAASGLPIGARCGLTLYLDPLKEVQAVSFSGRLVRQLDTGYGMRFEAADRAGYALYVQRLLRIAPAPATLRAERLQGDVPELQDWDSL